MIKKLLLFLILIIKTQLISQNKDINFGLKAGINYSKYSPNPSSIIGQETGDYNRKLSYYGGFFVTLKVSDRFSFQPEFLFSEQGSEFLIENIEIFDQNGSTLGISDFRYHQIDYTLALPLNFKYKVFDKFFLESGFQFEYIFNSKYVIKEDPLLEVSAIASPNSDIESGNFEIGSILGISYQLNDNIDITFRNLIGLTKKDNGAKSIVSYLGIQYNL